MINVGAVGVGMIGQDHIRRLTQVLTGARVAAVADTDTDRARAVAATVPGCAAFSDGEALIGSAGVDAVVVTSWGPTHERYVLAALALGKPVFCEKPLATSVAACARIVAAEVAAGRRLVQVGFMRRFDPRYRAVRDVVAGGTLGAPLLMHAAHRNPSVPPHFTGEMIISDSAVHDIDVARWLFADEVTAVTVHTPRRNRRAIGFADPVLMLLEMRGGALVDVEVSLHAGYGYDIRGEVVCEDGVVALSESPGAVVRARGDGAPGTGGGGAGDAGGRAGGRVSGPVPADWRERFADAFDAELRAWLDSQCGGPDDAGDGGVGGGGGTGDSGAGAGAVGPSAWDGYAVTAVCEGALRALAGGTRELVEIPVPPPLYNPC